MERQTCILIVDDERLVVQSIRMALGQAGYATLTAEDGTTALHLARAHKPDLILLDVVLPDLSGMEVCQRIKADPELAGIFVILFSARMTESEKQAQGLEVGADGYIIRPITNRELIARVQALLRIQRAERALRESEETFRTLAESAPVGIVLSTPDGRILYVNPAFLTMTGLSRDEFMDQGWLQTVVPEDHARVIEQMNRVVAQKERVVFEHRLRHVSGEQMWAETYASPVVGPDGQVYRQVGVVLDITRRKRAEEQLTEQLAELRRWYAIMHDREMRVLELKREVNELLAQAGQPARYPSVKDS